jgi:GTPase
VTLKRVYLLIDARHGIKKNDEEVMDLLDKAAVSYQVVLTKIDKIKEAGVPRVLAETAERIKKRRPAAYPEVLATSSEKNAGSRSCGRRCSSPPVPSSFVRQFRRLEGQRHAIDAVTLAGRRRAVVEDVAEMAAAAAAVDFGASFW